MLILLIFKYINDVFGYKYGDEILINYAATISNELRTGEVLGRVSADNFVILRYYNEKKRHYGPAAAGRYQNNRIHA